MILYHFLLVLCYAVQKYWPVSAFALASESMFATALPTDSVSGGQTGCKVAFWGSNSVGLLRFDSPFELTGGISHTLPFIQLSCWLLFHLAIPFFRRLAIHWNQSASDMPKPVSFQYFTIYSDFFIKIHLQRTWAINDLSCSQSSGRWAGSRALASSNPISLTLFVASGNSCDISPSISTLVKSNQ